nr:hypothetical protein CFP56_33508 [Quercus suber]
MCREVAQAKPSEAGESWKSASGNTSPGPPLLAVRRCHELACHAGKQWKVTLEIGGRRAVGERAVCELADIA